METKKKKLRMVRYIYNICDVASGYCIQNAIMNNVKTKLRIANKKIVFLQGCCNVKVQITNLNNTVLYEDRDSIYVKKDSGAILGIKGVTSIILIALNHLLGMGLDTTGCYSERDMFNKGLIVHIYIYMKYY